MACLLLLWATGQAVAKEKWPYQDRRLPVERRVADLLSRMTWAEKLGQLRCTMAWNYYDNSGKHVRPSASFTKAVDEGHIGMLWATYRADPWTQKSLANGLTPERAAEAGNALQRYVRQHTRLGIPLFLAEEAPHGHMAIGATVFPTGLGMAATWSPGIAEQAGQVMANEVRMQGAHISYGPVMDLSRDPRWSRVEESMGEDPVLTAAIGSALVRGTGAGDLAKPYATIATLKHFIGYGTTEGGQNGAPSVIGSRDLLQNFMYPFRQAIKAGALSVMTSYNSLDGIPSTCNAYLLNDVLRKQWKFDGFVVSDLFSIDGIYGTHHVAKSLQEAGSMALRAGVDVDLGAGAYGKLAQAPSLSQEEQAAIDTAVARVLRLKFEMGLFEQPFVDPKAAREVGSSEHAAVARAAAKASITLLENRNHVLPLRKEGIKIAVIGPNADNIYNMLGDYTAPQAPQRVSTVLAGIIEMVGKEHVVYAKGCAIRDTTDSDIAGAVAAARGADVVVACVGGSSARDFKTSYQATGAAEVDTIHVSDMESGEGFDRSTLTLLGRQNELLQALKQTGKPLVVVYIEGRPLDKRWAKQHADALLTAYYPGQEGGKAIADVLFGDYNPAGRLPISVPRSVGQLPVYYNHRAPSAHNYVEESAQPLYPFGYGLSYTTFEYSNLQVKGRDISFDITNTGDRDGEEVAQLYTHFAHAPVVQPVLQLRHFRRLNIKKGETVHVNFTLTDDDLTIIGPQMQPLRITDGVEIMVGSSSKDLPLKAQLGQ